MKCIYGVRRRVGIANLYRTVLIQCVLDKFKQRVILIVLSIMDGVRAAYERRTVGGRALHYRGVAVAYVLLH